MAQSSRCWVCLIVVVSLVSGVWTGTPFSILPTFDCHIGNDPQLGLGSADTGGSGMHIRDRSPRCRYVV
jgi:hypothetical protein